MKQLAIALKATVVLTLLTGVVYPLVVTVLAKVIFPHQAEGSLITKDGKVAGSALIGQRFTKPEYFHGRPSAAGNDGYDGLNSGGSNYGPTNQKLIDRVKADLKTFRAENPAFTGPVPADQIQGGLGYDAAVDAACRRTPSASLDCLRDLVGRPGKDGFDRAVAAISHPARKPERDRLVVHKGSKPDAVDAAEHQHVPNHQGGASHGSPRSPARAGP